MTSPPSFEDSSPSSYDDQVEATVPSACMPSVAGAEAWQHVPETLISWSCHADACRGVEVDLPLREKRDKPRRRHMGYEPATAAARVSTGYEFEQGLDQQQLGLMTSKLIHGDAVLKLLLCRRGGKWQCQRCPCLSPGQESTCCCLKPCCRLVSPQALLQLQEQGFDLCAIF